MRRMGKGNQKYAGAGQYDELTVLGIAAGIVWILIAAAWTRRSGFRQLVWLCDLATLGTAVGLLCRSKLILSAQLVGTLICHLGWQADFLSYYMLGRLPLGATAYMFSNDLGTYEKALSFLQHTFVIPACIYALFRLGVSRLGWVFQTIQTTLAFLLTYLFTRPEENINWIFGAGFAALSPASMNYGFYIAMVAAPPLLIYFPLNRLLLNYLPVVDSSAVCASARFRRATAALTCCAGAMCISLAVARTCYVEPNLPARFLELPSTGPIPLESVASGPDSPTISSFSYGLPGQQMEIPLVPAAAILPRIGSRSGEWGLVPRDGSGILSPAGFPEAPQEIVIRGNRGRKGTVICAVVGSDRLYAQSPCDCRTAIDRFELHCRLGSDGLSEFIDPRTGLRREASEHRFANGPAMQSLFSLTIVAFDRHMKASRTLTYVLRRTGVFRPDDVLWPADANPAAVLLLPGSAGF